MLYGEIIADTRSHKTHKYTVHTKYRIFFGIKPVGIERFNLNYLYSLISCDW